MRQALGIVLLLAGCATAPVAPPLTVEKVRIVDRPMPVPCVRAADIPVMPTPPMIPADPDIEQRAAWVGIWINQLRHYAVGVRAALIACSKEGP
jgi:hypothetical protein